MRMIFAVSRSTAARGLALFVLLSTAACGSSNDLPSSPSAVAGTASIRGMVMSGSASGLTVAIPGTAMVSLVSSDGQFSLANVPGGRIELRVTGPGIDARIDLGVVQAGEIVTITLRVNGTAVLLESVTRRFRDDEVRGVVTLVSGGCPSLTLMVGQRIVRTNAGTLFRRVTCELLVNGQFVEIDGSPDSNGAVLATRVQLENATDITQTGGVAAFFGSCPSVSFSIAGRAFFTNNTTEFIDMSCSQLRDGTNVEARGHLQSNGAVLAERVRRR